MLGRDAVQHFTGTRLQTLDRCLARRGFWAVLAARLVPVVPFNALNYLCGLTGVRPSRYALATILGILPGTTAYVAVGAYGHQPGSLPFLTAIGALIALSVVGAIVARRRRRAPDEDADTTPTAGDVACRPVQRETHRLRTATSARVTPVMTGRRSPRWTSATAAFHTPSP